jgi:hypothetical protein
MRKKYIVWKWEIWDLCRSNSDLHYIYGVIETSLCTWWLQNRKLQVMFEVSPASLQIFIDTSNCVFKERVQYSTVHIPNVFCDGHLQIINFGGIVRIHLSAGAQRPFDHPVLLRHCFEEFKWVTKERIWNICSNKNRIEFVRMAKKNIVWTCLL